ncbi:unnamed protein product [Triticum turgidum subsp. durum]|uniref:K Homology domain-containing protein n=1 Tax=Triticum turgidum subsp. durum TaxID=4567 RepID=A0A9R0SKK5_TRITD|nr:unnamed protein product [Triticum turgidum subsp. durum]
MKPSGKRTSQHRDHDREDRDQKRRPSHTQETSGTDELVVYRILCPDKVIGSVIGKGGKVINSIRQQTNAKVKIVDPYPGADKRVILVYCYVKHRDVMISDIDAAADDDREPVCAAQSALLKVHDAIVDALAITSDSDDKEANILVPASQAASVIGKSGSVIKRLRSVSKSFIKVKPKENISLETSIDELPPTIILPSELPVYPASSLYSVSDASVSSGHPSLSILGARSRGSHVPEFTVPTDAHGGLPIYQSMVPAIPTYNTPKCSGELLVRVVCPGDKIGLVIGKGGMTIKNIRKESGASVDVDDAKNDKEESIITISSTEATNDVKSAAVEAVLLLQAKINDETEDRMHLRLLVPGNVIGCLIGKGGSIINDMRNKSKAIIHISKGTKPRKASSNDELVEVFGEVDKLRDALVQIVLRLREEVLKDSVGRQNSGKDGKLTVATTEPVYSSSFPMPALLPYSQQITPLRHEQRGEAERGLNVFPRSSLYHGYSPRQAVDDGFGVRSSYTSKPYGRRVPDMEMFIPSSGLSKVMGKHGTNLDNIRKISGADIEIIESKSSRHEHVANIFGTPEQRQSAENLIKAFIMST